MLAAFRQLSRSRLVLWILTLVALGLGACHRERVRQDDSGEALASLDFGVVELGGAAHAQTALPLGRVPVLLELEEAPLDVEAPPRLFSRPNDPAWLRVRWQPEVAGELDDSLIYRMSVGSSETRFRIQLRGKAVVRERVEEDAGDADAPTDGEIGAADAETDAARPCQGNLACDDDDPCTEDSCGPGLGCRHTPASEGQPCGPFDCAHGHFCNAGRCIEVDMREVSDGMACDDGDPCTRDGQCRTGLCYASVEPRTPRVLDTLHTFGDGMSDAAHAAGTYVFVGLNRLDVLTEREGVLQHQARLLLPGARFVESAGTARFLVRTQDGKVQRLDTRQPAAPTLQPLGHIVPMAAAYADSTTLRAQFEDMWAVMGDSVVIATSSWAGDDRPTYYAATIAPIAPGPARALDVPLYRVAAADDLMAWAWAQPGIAGQGEAFMGVVRLENGSAKLEASVTLAAAQAAGCGQPKFVAASGSWLASLSRDDFPSGTSYLCLWRFDSATKVISVAAAHPIYERFQDPAIALDNEALYITTTTLWSSGFAGGLIGKGQLKRLPLPSLLANNDPIPYSSAPLLGPQSGTLLKIDDGRLLVVGDTLSVLRLNGEPVTGPGHGAISGALGFAQGSRLLVGGRSNFGLLDVDSATLKLHAREWFARYPKGGALHADLRVLRAEGRAKNLTPATQSPHIKITSLEQLTAQLGADGRLQVVAQPRSLSLGYGWVSSAVSAGAYTLHVEGSLLVFGDGDGSEPSRRFSVPNWTRGSETFPELFLRPTSRSESLLVVHGDQLGQVDPLRTESDAGVAMQTLPPARDLPGGSFPWAASSVALSDDHVLRGERQGLVLYSRTDSFPPAYLSFEDAADDGAVRIPESGAGWALVSYRDRSGQDWLVQLRVADGKLEELDRLATAGEVVSGDPVGEHWLLSTPAGAQLVDLRCWPGGAR